MNIDTYTTAVDIRAEITRLSNILTVLRSKDEKRGARIEECGAEPWSVVIFSSDLDIIIDALESRVYQLENDFKRL